MHPVLPPRDENPLASRDAQCSHFVLCKILVSSSHSRHPSSRLSGRIHLSFCLCLLLLLQSLVWICISSPSRTGRCQSCSSAASGLRHQDVQCGELSGRGYRLLAPPQQQLLLREATLAVGLVCGGQSESILVGSDRGETDVGAS